jgi:hypothetical protein
MGEASRGRSPAQGRRDHPGEADGGAHPLAPRPRDAAPQSGRWVRVGHEDRHRDRGSVPGAHAGRGHGRCRPEVPRMPGGGTSRRRRRSCLRLRGSESYEVPSGKSVPTTPGLGRARAVRTGFPASAVAAGDTILTGTPSSVDLLRKPSTGSAVRDGDDLPSRSILAEGCQRPRSPQAGAGPGEEQPRRARQGGRGRRAAAASRGQHPPARSRTAPRRSPRGRRAGTGWRRRSRRVRSRRPRAG